MTRMVPFTKMNGLANAIVVADMRGRADALDPGAVVALCREGGIDLDQCMAVHSPRTPGTDGFLAIFNRDGSKARACGNGMRCVAYVLAAETGRDAFTFETDAGVLYARVGAGGIIAVDMGAPQFDWDRIPLSEPFADTRAIELQVGPIDAPVLHSPSAVSMGNPHAVFWVDGDLASYDLDRFGPMLENHPIFPEGANISIARIAGTDRLEARTWERGAGLTRACGSAACAVAVSAARNGCAGRRVTVRLPGGELLVDWRDDSGRVVMSGPVEREFSGMLDPRSGNWRSGCAAADA